MLIEEDYTAPGIVVHAPGPPRQQFGHQESTSSNDPLLSSSQESAKKEKDKKAFLAKRSKRLKVCLIVIIVTFIVSFILALPLGGGTVWWLYYGITNAASREPVYAEGGETVVVAVVTDTVALTWNSLTISECHVTAGDFPHSNQLYIVPDNMLQRHSRFVNIDYTDLFNQTETDCTNNILPDQFYVLDRTFVEMEICVTSDTEPTRDGTLLIFDNNGAYDQFKSNGDCESTRLAASIHNINIGSSGTFECTPIKYMAQRSSHLYAVPVIPGKVWYKYRYNYTQFYLDQNDFGDLQCEFSSEGKNNCPIGLLSHTPTYLIVYVEPTAEDNSKSTHLCLHSDWSIGLMAIVVVFGFLAIVFLLTTCILSFCLCCVCYKCKDTNKQLRGLLTSSTT